MKGRRGNERQSGPAQMETFRIEVGSVHGIKPGNIVGAIANEADIEGVHIGRVDIREDHSYVDLPEGMPKEIFKELAEGARGGPRAAHQPGERETAETAAGYAGAS